MRTKTIYNLSSFIEHPKWNKFPNLEINSIEFNTKKNLITFSTNTGYRIFDLKTFKLLSILDETQEMIGNISKANVLYSSEIICFLGGDNNNYFKSNQLIFFDDFLGRSIGSLDFQERIFNFFITQYMVFICLWNKIYIFELLSLKYIHKINRVDVDDNLISVQENYNNGKKIISLSYVSTIYNQENIIDIINYWIDDKSRVTHYNKKIIKTNFENIKKIYLEGEEKIIVVNDLGNKVHIYQTNNNQLLFCIYMGNQRLNTSNFSLDPKDKFMLCLCDMDEIDIFKLTNIDNKKYVCLCNSRPDQNIYSRRKSSLNSFMGGYFNRIFNGSTVPFLYDHINQYADFYKCSFDNKRKDEIILINNLGIAFRYKFNRIKEKEPLKLIKEEILFDEIEEEEEN